MTVYTQQKQPAHNRISALIKRHLKKIPTVFFSFGSRLFVQFCVVTATVTSCVFVRHLRWTQFEFSWLWFLFFSLSRFPQAPAYDWYLPGIGLWICWQTDYHMLAHTGVFGHPLLGSRMSRTCVSEWDMKAAHMTCIASCWADLQ